MSCVNNEEMGRDKELIKLKTQQSINRILKKTQTLCLRKRVKKGECPGLGEPQRWITLKGK